MDRALLNQLNRQSRIDPEQALIKLRVIQHVLALSDAEQKIKDLRTRGLKREREIRQACLFCYGMSCRIGQKVWVYPVEDSDYDCVASWEVDSTRHFAPIQLKEVVPAHLNHEADLQAIIDGLTKYPVSADLTVAIYVNQNGRFEPSSIKLPNLSIAALWVFGTLAPDQSEWFLCGNFLETPEMISFSYPT